MKKVILASVLATATASASFAGGYSEPVMTPAPVVVEEGSSGFMGDTTTLVLLAAAAAVVAIAASN